MTPSRDASDIFHEARRMERCGWAAYLDGACAGDPVLRAEVEVLLRADAEAGSFLETASPLAIEHAGPREEAGQEIGRYKLLQQIGEGGFGTVWMAEQREPVRRKVALKVIKLGMDTRQVIARFEAERQALALMDHPNIAKVFDAGATETGRPYFVMELVKGVPITEYCDTESLTTGERLRLFMRVCHAVQHAHQKGIIHRDLKPSNVLVTLHDGEPVPKVIDFGIAKATNRELTDKTLFTEFRQFMGTPEYMSPEQAEMSGLDIDTRSDIYSLGVLLYELLTGVTPFDGKRLRSAALAEIQRIIREEEPPRPSTRLSGGRATPGPGRETGGPAESEQSSVHYITKHRRTDPRSLTRQLRGDLDWIVMKCLEKDRSRRYETANGLALDIERHLSDEPVMATPPSRVYRLRKLARRNRSVCTAAAVVFLTLALGVVGTTAGMLRAMDAEARVGRELVRTREVKRLITEMLSSVSPEVAQSADTTLLKRILDDTATRLRSGEVKDELVRAELHQVVGQAYHLLGLLDVAEQHLAPSLEILRTRLGGEHPSTLTSTFRLAGLRHHQGRYAEAETLSVSALASMERVLGRADPSTLSARNNLAMLRTDQGRFAEAEQLLLKTLADMGRVLGEESPDTLRCMTNLATLYHEQFRYADAEPVYLKTLEIKRRVLGEDHPDTLRCMNNLGSLYVDQGHYAEGEPLFREVLERRERVLGQQHPETLTASLNVGIVCQRRGKLGEAEGLLARTLSDQQKVIGEDHPDVAICMTELASVYEQTGRFADAEPLFAKALEIRRRSLGEQHPLTLGAKTNLAHTHMAVGRYGEARGLLEAVVPVKKRVLGLPHPWTRLAMRKLAELYTRLGEDDLAVPIFRELVVSAPADEPNAAGVLKDINDLGILLRNQGHLTEAEPLLRRAMEGNVDLLGPRDPQTLASITNLGLLCNDAHRFGEARDLLERSVPAKREILGIGHPWTRTAMDGLATAYSGLGRSEDAILIRRELLDLSLSSAERPDATAGTLNSAAWELLTIGRAELRDPARAVSLAERACALEQASGSRDLWIYLDTLALAQHMSGDTASAAETQRRAVSLMPEGGDPEMAERLARYEAALVAQGEPANKEKDR